MLAFTVIFEPGTQALPFPYLKIQMGAPAFPIFAKSGIRHKQSAVSIQPIRLLKNSKTLKPTYSPLGWVRW
jgi:hypothetical protein